MMHPCKQQPNHRLRKRSIIKNIAISIAFALLFSVVPLRLNCNENSVKFEHLTLPQSVIFSINQDKVGFMWFATDDGLNRFDGYDVKVFKPDRENNKSISANFIYCVYPDSAGTIWIGTRGGGLNKFDYDTEEFTHYTSDKNNPHSISSNNAYTIFEDSRNELWIGTYGGGLNKFDRETEEFISYKHDPGNPATISSNEIRTIAEDKWGNLWIGTDKGGLNRFDRETERFERFLHNPGDPGSISSNFIYKICPSKTGDFWIATRAGFDKFSPQTKTFSHYKNTSSHLNSSKGSYVSNYVYTIMEDRAGKLWIGTRGGGLDIFDPTTGKQKHFLNDPEKKDSLSHNNVYSIFQDKSGLIWLGTLGGGVNKFDPLRYKFTTRTIMNTEKKSINDSIYSFYEDSEENLWIGTAGGGVVRHDRKSNEYRIFQINPEDPDTFIKNDVYSMLEDHTGTFWIGTSAGLYSLDRNKGVFTYHFTQHYNDNQPGHENMIFSIFEDSAQNLWIGTNEGGLNLYDRDKNSFTFFPVDKESEKSSNTHVYSIHEQKEGIIWLGTGEGLKRLEFSDLTGRKLKKFTLYIKSDEHLNSISHNTILSIYEDSRGNLWIGTRGGGLLKYNAERDNFLRYGKKDGLPNEIIYGILEDWQGYLWLSTKKGIAKFNPQRGAAKNYDKSDGLQSDEFNIGAYLKTKNGQLFFGGQKGYNAFFPTDIRENSYIPPVLFTAFKQGGESVPLEKNLIKTDAIKLGWQNNFFEFEYVALNYSQTEKNKYAYFLEGHDKQWYYAENKRFGRYTGLPGGTYTLRVKGANNDGRWNDEGAAIQIQVSRPFFEAWWFYALLVEVLLIVIIVIYRIRVKQLSAEKESELLTKEMEFSRKIMESIEYAKTIQLSILPSRQKIEEFLKRYFVIWKPRDIVGGDFYWFRKISETQFIIAVIDCTGHSVPGAFMTMITNSELNRVVDELYIKRPSEILKALNKKIRAALRQNLQEDVLNNGLDMGLCFIDIKAREITFSGAKFSLFYTRNGAVNEIKGDKQRIGYLESDESFIYKDHRLTYTPQDYFYLTSDGYLEQCGGENGLPLSKKRFREYISTCYGKSMEEQRKLLEDKISEYRDTQPQMDDIIVFGFKLL